MRGAGRGLVGGLHRGGSGREHRLEWTGGEVFRILDAAFRRFVKPLLFKQDLGGGFKDGTFQSFPRAIG